MSLKLVYVALFYCLLVGQGVMAGDALDTLMRTGKCIQCDFSDLSLEKHSLVGVDLTGANLDRVNFQAVN